jgi:hypothetical protein
MVSAGIVQAGNDRSSRDLGLPLQQGQQLIGTIFAEEEIIEIALLEFIRASTTE